jgi:multiple sugar transport system substrate-binding protein
MRRRSRLKPLLPLSTSRQWPGMFALLGMFSALVLVLTGCGNRGAATKDGKPIVRVWHVWGGTMAEGFRNIAAAFRASHPDIELELVFAANDLSTNQKFFTAVAAKTPPEVIFVDGPQVAPWAEWGALEPLTERCEEAGITEADYFPPCWRQCDYKGDVWALTFCADPNFGFVWNKADFRRAGLDPEKPPKTIDELDGMADKLTRTREGELISIGLIPWAQYGGANSIFTWGWAFGGRFYDYEKQEITCDDPRIVKALEWMCSYAKKHDVTKIASLQQGFGTQENNPFYTGQMSMMCLHIGGIAEIERYAPSLDYGVGFIPHPEGGEEHSSWVGGWCVGIPRNARNQDAGWEFIRWLCHSDEGTRLCGEETGLFPGAQESPYFEQVKDKPFYQDFYRILVECRHQRPVMPVQAFYMRALQRAVDAAVYGTKTPEEALQEAKIATQRELDLVLGRG